MSSSLNTLDDIEIEVEIRAIENTEFGVTRSPSLSCLNYVFSNTFNITQRDFEMKYPKNQLGPSKKEGFGPVFFLTQGS